MSDYVIFSDESGSWHEQDNVYVRSWVCVENSDIEAFDQFIAEIRNETGCDEVRWKTVATKNDLVERIKKLNFKTFVTVTEPKSIKDEKYLLTRSFFEKVASFDFGNLKDDTKEKIVNKIYSDIKYVLFLQIYESLHIRSADEIFSLAFPNKSFDYKIDPPQATKKEWSEICTDLTGYTPYFPKSERDSGIQFADIVAGAWRSHLIQDKRSESAKKFICEGLMPEKMLYIKGNPNPNLIIHEESSEEIKKLATVSSCKV